MTKKQEAFSLKFDTDWQYSPAVEPIDHVELKEKYDLFIGGTFVPSHSKKYFESINPSTEDSIAQLAIADEIDVDNAVKAARKAFPSWAKLPSKERGKYIFRIARLIQERAKEFAIIETLDGGKPIREASDIDIPLAAAHFFYYAGWADKLQYAFPNRKIEPLGVVGQIIPWNSPLLMAAWKIAPALACGNTVVLKPSENTSLTALKLAELIKDAELPDGVVNIVTGAEKTGIAIVNHPGIDKVAFTGSTTVGKSIQRSITESKRLSLELRGKAVNIIFDDAAIDQAVEGVVNGIFFNQGHVCCAGSRLLVQESIKVEVERKLKARMETLIVGDPMDKNTDIGAINSKRQLKAIEAYLKVGEKEGFESFQLKNALPKKGYYCQPTLFFDVAQSSRLVKEEVFGPVLTIQTFRTIDEAIEKANNTSYRLSAGVWTDKGSKAFNLSAQLKAAVVWVNTFNKFDPTSPFGSYKESGFGREGGLQGLEAYLKFK